MDSGSLFGMKTLPVLVGVNHRTAPIAVRERLSISSYVLPSVLTTLKRMPVLQESAVLSTCNRTEIYAAASDTNAAYSALIDFLSFHSGFSAQALKSSLYFYEGQAAVSHLFGVTAGLDSMILGESEIAFQVKQAYAASHAQGSTGPLLNGLFQKALHSTKLIRSQTHVAEGCASIGSVVVELVQTLFGSSLSQCDVLLWGAGKAAETTVRHLMKNRIRQLWVVNRTQPKAQDLARLCAGGWLSWEQGIKHLAHVDIAVVCTQAPHYVIDENDFASVLPARANRPLCLIDLSVPRNIDPQLSNRPNVHLYNIDTLQSIAQTRLNFREQERASCEALIAKQVAHWMRRHSAPALQEVQPC